MYVFHRVEELVQTCSDTRRAIGQFVLEEHAHLADFSISDVAAKTFTSKASVSRFAQSLGFDGWREFLREFCDEQARMQKGVSIVDPNYPFDGDTGQEQIIQNIADLQAEAIADTMRILDRGMLARAVGYLRRAHSVWVMGLSPNCYLGELFCRKLLTIGKPAQVVTMGECGIVSRSLCPTDCAIIVSYSGDNEQATPMSCVPVLKSRKVPTIAITSEGHNYLRMTVPCTLTIASRENLYAKIATFATEQSMLYLFNILFALYFAQDYGENLARKLETGSSLELLRKSTFTNE